LHRITRKDEKMDSEKTSPMNSIRRRSSRFLPTEGVPLPRRKEYPHPHPPNCAQVPVHLIPSLLKTNNIEYTCVLNLSIKNLNSSPFRALLATNRLRIDQESSHAAFDWQELPPWQGSAWRSSLVGSVLHRRAHFPV
jgi:hypothetical protein